MTVARESANFRFVRKYIYIILFIAVSPVVYFGKLARLGSLMQTCDECAPPPGEPLLNRSIPFYRCNYILYQSGTWIKRLGPI